MQNVLMITWNGNSKNIKAFKRRQKIIPP